MKQVYLRPLSLVFGEDARMLIGSGEAGALGGFSRIAFSQVEIITRDGESVARYIRPFFEFRNHPLLADVTKPRSTFGGLDLKRTQIMGIVNVTPDSFSDGGHYSESDTAIVHGQKLANDGADILDVGGESTRPGSSEVLLDDERARILPVIKALAETHVVSVDTRKSVLMREAAALGARIVNDVSALGFDEHSGATLKQLDLPVVLMHAQGEPRTMQLAPKYSDVALDVYDWLAERIAFAVSLGIPKERICVDPGIGFGKTIHHNMELMRQLALFHGLGVGLLIGLSRKNFVGVLTGEKVAAQRVAGSVGGALQAAMMGAHILRVHDVKETVDALAVFQGTLDPASTDV